MRMYLCRQLRGMGDDTAGWGGGDRGNAYKPQLLIDAALAYTVQAQDRLSEAGGEGVGADGPDTYWPWDLASFNESDDELCSLAKARALLAAAYDAAVARRNNGPEKESYE